MLGKGEEGGAHLQEHVSRFDPAVCGHGSALHDGTDVDAAVAPVVALAHDADTQEVVLLCHTQTPGENQVTGTNGLKGYEAKEYLGIYFQQCFQTQSSPEVRSR